MSREKIPERDTQLIDTDRMADEFVPFDGFVEGHFAHLLPCDRIVVMRLRPDKLAARLAARGYSKEKTGENRDAEALDVCLIETVEEYEPDEIFELDTTGKSLLPAQMRSNSFTGARSLPRSGRSTGRHLPGCHHDA